LIDCSFNELIGKKTIILGEVSTGKTVITRKLLEEAVSHNGKITILDFAPPERVEKGIKFGGHLYKENRCKVRNIKSDMVKTPRLSAKNSEELIKMAEFNEKITSCMLKKFMESPTDTLFINDVSIYLHKGSLRLLLDVIRRIKTVIINGYLGEYLDNDHGTGLSCHENIMMRRLAARMDRVIKLEKEA
jgi:hypothetical protein